MNSRTDCACLIGLAAVVLQAMTLPADEPKAVTTAPQTSPVSAAAVADLDKTYRLEFKLVTSESSQSYVVLTSQSVYAIRYGIHKDGEEYNFDIAGTLSPCEKDDRLRVSFKLAIERTNQDGNRFDLASTSSAIVAPDKPKTVAVYGEYELKLTVSADNEADQAKADASAPAN
jgi:hypothetical protein